MANGKQTILTDEGLKKAGRRTRTVKNSNPERSCG